MKQIMTIIVVLTTLVLSAQQEEMETLDVLNTVDNGSDWTQLAIHTLPNKDGSRVYGIFYKDVEDSKQKHFLFSADDSDMSTFFYELSTATPDESKLIQPSIDVVDLWVTKSEDYIVIEVEHFEDPQQSGLFGLTMPQMEELFDLKLQD